MEKECHTCHTIKPLEDFRKLSCSNDGYSDICRECKIKQEKLQRIKRAEKLNNGINVVETKTCYVCKETKSVSKFSKHYGRKDGYCDCCKSCANIKSKEKRECIKNSVKIVKTHKVCNKCGKDKNIEEFGVIKKNKDGYNTICKECKRKHDNKHYHDRKDNLTPIQILKRTISGSIREWFRFTDKRKNKATLDYGIDVNNILETIGERPYNNFQLDHIIPLSLFDYSKEWHIYLSQHPSNLRWISEDDNNTKNDFIIWDLIKDSEFLLCVACEVLELDSSYDGMRARDIIRNKQTNI